MNVPVDHERLGHAPMVAPRPTSDFSETDLERLVHRFYERVREDPDIGPVFERAVDDWPEHLERLTGFWTTVMMGIRRYKGNPLAVHLGLPLNPNMFHRWLALWEITVPEYFSPPASDLLIKKAQQMARNMQFALFESSPPPSPKEDRRMTRDYAPFSEAPQFITQVFDEQTLPEQLRKEHHIKAGRWGLIRVLEGTATYHVVDPPSQVTLVPGKPGLVWPEQFHYLTPIGAVKIQIEFYNSPPNVAD